MARDDKVCILCGKAYKYCEACPSKYNVTETWRNIFCSENCREIYGVYDSIKAGLITDKDAGKKLAKFDTSYMDRFNEPMKSALVVALNSTVKSQPVKQEKKVEEIKSENKKETPKKRGRKKNSEVD